MKLSLKVRTWKGALIHIGVIVLLTFLIVYGFFNWFLPSYTKHGETIQVPSLENLSFEEASDILKSNKLRVQALDTAYSEKHAPGAIIRQEPNAEASVKENRTIYLTLNTMEAPTIEFTEDLLKSIIHKDPDVLKLKLPNLHLKLGEENLVDGFPIIWKIYYDGKEIVPGMKLPRNARIDYDLGKGNQNANGFTRAQLDSLAVEEEAEEVELDVLSEGEDEELPE